VYASLLQQVGREIDRADAMLLNTAAKCAKGEDHLVPLYALAAEGKCVDTYWQCGREGRVNRGCPPRRKFSPAAVIRILQELTNAQLVRSLPARQGWLAPPCGHSNTEHTDAQKHFMVRRAERNRLQGQGLTCGGNQMFPAEILMNRDVCGAETGDALGILNALTQAMFPAEILMNRDVCEAETGGALGILNALTQAIEQPSPHPQSNLLTAADLPELPMLYSRVKHTALLPRSAKVACRAPMIWSIDTVINFARVQEEWDYGALTDSNPNSYVPDAVAGMSTRVLPESDGKSTGHSLTTSITRGSQAVTMEMKDLTPPAPFPRTANQRSPLLPMLAFLVARAQAASPRVLTANAWSNHYCCIMLSPRP